MPAGSLSVKVPRGFPVLQVSMVGKDGEGVFGPSQVVPPMGKHFYHSKQLSFIDVIVMLCGGKGGRVVSDRVEFGFPLFGRGHVPFTSLLGEYCSDPICRGVGLQIEAVFEVRLNEDWFSAHEGFERFKCLELGFSLVPYYTFLCKVEEGTGNFGVVGDEVAVVPGKSQEGVDISGVFGHWPICHTA